MDCARDEWCVHCDRLFVGPDCVVKISSLLVRLSSVSLVLSFVSNRWLNYGPQIGQRLKLKSRSQSQIGQPNLGTGLAQRSTKVERVPFRKRAFSLASSSVGEPLFVAGAHGLKERNKAKSYLQTASLQPTLRPHLAPKHNKLSRASALSGLGSGSAQ